MQPFFPFLHLCGGGKNSKTSFTCGKNKEMLQKNKLAIAIIIQECLSDSINKYIIQSNNNDISYI
jgi:hypothetical protein